MTKSNVIKADQLVDTPATYDAVNQPAHYKVGGIETIDFMQAKLSKQQFEGYLAGNVIKYISRYQHKNGVEDLKKARWYLDRLIEEGEQT